MGQVSTLYHYLTLQRLHGLVLGFDPEVAVEGCRMDAQSVEAVRSVSFEEAKVDNG